MTNTFIRLPEVLRAIARALGVSTDELKPAPDDEIPLAVARCDDRTGVAIVGEYERPDGEIEPMRMFTLGESEIASLSTPTGKRQLRNRLERLYRDGKRIRGW